MAEIQEKSSGGKKGHQKKMTIRVDFTPMVDMNMLLITFFMLCTTMIKSQTLNIALPSNEKVDNVENMNQASEDDAVTIIIDAKRLPGSETVDSLNGQVQTILYYYEGKAGGPAGINGEVIQENNLKLTEFSPTEISATGIKTYNGIRKIVRKRNEDVIAKIDELRSKYQREGHSMTDEEKEAFNEEAKKIRADKNLSQPVFIIKSTPQASYGALVAVLDEMQINNIAKYQIDNMTHEDSLLLIDYQKSHPGK